MFARRNTSALLTLNCITIPVIDKLFSLISHALQKSRLEQITRTANAVDTITWIMFHCTCYLFNSVTTASCRANITTNQEPGARPASSGVGVRVGVLCHRSKVIKENFILWLHHPLMGSWQRNCVIHMSQVKVKGQRYRRDIPNPFYCQVLMGKPEGKTT